MTQYVVTELQKLVGNNQRRNRRLNETKLKIKKEKRKTPLEGRHKKGVNSQK